VEETAMRVKVWIILALVMPIVTKAQPIIINYPSSRYELRHLTINEPYYVDKEFLLTRIDNEIDRYLWLRTWNADQYNTSDEFLSLTLRDPMTVYIAYDYRCWDPPSWLENEFVNTTKYISVNDGNVKSYYLWKKSFPPGEVILGGNRAGGRGTSSRGMYLVIFATKKAETPSLVSPLDGNVASCQPFTRFTWRKADAAQTYYIKLSVNKSNSGIFYYDYTLADTTTLVSILQPNSTYYWCLQAMNETSKSDFTSWTMFSTILGEPPHANFIATPVSGPAPLTVAFTNTSTGNFNTSNWSFGDGQSSILTNPSHVYLNSGTYTVSLTVSGDAGSDQVVKTSHITVATPPVAEFIGSPTSGQAPLQVIFLDQSTGVVDTRVWTFGDGSTSSLQNPIHTYQNPGVYTVSLRVTGPSGSNEKTRTGYISCQAKVTAQFTAQPLSGPAPLKVNFTDQSLGDITDRLWLFGDGSSSNGVNPQHEYQNPGTYSVSLLASGPAGNVQMSKSDFITVTEPVYFTPPVAAFSASPLMGKKPLQVQFTNNSTGDVLNCRWEFGDGQVSQVLSPSHIYQETGTYTVRLIANGPVQCDTLTRGDFIKVIDDPTNLVSISVPVVAATPGQTFSVPINIANVTNKNIISYEFTLDFDPSILSPVGITTLNTVSAHFSMPLANYGQTGKVHVGNLGVTPLAQDGVLIYINFQVIGSIGASSQLAMSSFVCNGGSPEVVTAAGSVTIQNNTGIEKTETTVSEFALSSGYPNPFNHSVHMHLQMPMSSQVRIQVLDPLGRIIKILNNEILSAGTHHVAWDGTDDQRQSAPSGLYLIVAENGSARIVTKVAFIR